MAEHYDVNVATGLKKPTKAYHLVKLIVSSPSHCSIKIDKTEDCKSAEISVHTGIEQS
ncbi:hypothetical protein M0G43_03685 [Subsaxibacter sp. CAU 1640]|uniref:hypothetical protein n=1 Tax=Subsaxibacter sp. CAU 1640 TaxID=2933271 RepID=UPI002003FFBC|nr:hypothetical protein [Subsaxibacter sp. CAU 1640]MCK7589664.1 hypothetical protein [Subsaxibacter sp. CAU 1640]